MYSCIYYSIYIILYYKELSDVFVSVLIYNELNEKKN